MARITMVEHFAKYDVTAKREGNSFKILAPWGEWVTLPLVKGSKTWTLGWSMLAGSSEWEIIFNGKKIRLCGTCSHNCEHCYAKGGHYVHSNVKNANGWRTVAAHVYREWLSKAIIAQLMWGDDWKKEDDGTWSRIPSRLCRIHVSGDFFSPEYVQMWHDIISACSVTKFWAYTKEENVESLLSLSNFNLVRSILPNGRFNFGTIDEILDAKAILEDMGIKTHICLCALDQKGTKKADHHHCVNCTACSKLTYVLFLKHGDRKYNPLKDPRWEEFKAIVLAQPSMLCD